MNTEAVAFILIILVISASVFITVSNMNKTVQELSNTVSNISAELNTIKQAVNLTEDYRVLLSILGPIALEKLEKIVVLEDYIIYVVQGVGAGDILAPHLYEWFLDGVDDYIVVHSLLFSYPMTINIMIKPFVSRTMHYIYASRSGCDGWGVENETHVSQVDNYFSFFSKTNDVTHIDKRSIAQVTGGWHFISVVLDSTYRFYLNGSLIDSAVITGTPDFSTYDAVTIIGKPVINIRYMYGLMSKLLIHNRALSDSEIQQIYSNNVINASGLRLLLDATFYNSTHYIDLSNNGNHGVPYGGVQRVPAEKTWIWYIKNATSDNGVWLRFFPTGTLIVYRTGEIEKITSTEYYTNRTDIMLVMIPRGAIK